MKLSRGRRARRRSQWGAALALVAASLLSCGLAEDAKRPDGRYTLLGVYPGTDGGGLALATVGPMTAWQAKPNAILNVYGGSAAAGDLMDAAWTDHGAVPMLSFYPPTPNSAVAKGNFDASTLLPLVSRISEFLAGSDGALGTGDDRRAYLRYAWESNRATYAYSPCNTNRGEPPATFRSAWRHVHRLFSEAGITRRQLAWVFSVSYLDSCRRGKPEKTYPGSRYVDWFGIDGYPPCGVRSRPAQIFDPMLVRLGAIDRSKPIGVNEVGFSSFEGTRQKNRWIRRYWGYLRERRLRMSLWFNTDKGDSRSCAEFEKPWAVFGTTHGDSRETECIDESCATTRQHRGFSAYREGVTRAWVKGSDPSNLRYLPTRWFLGR